MKTILLSQKIHASAMEMLEGEFNILIPSEQGQQAFDALVPKAEGIILRTNVVVTGEAIKRAKDLKIICRTGVGVDNIDLDAAREAGVMVCNAPQANSVSVAEHAVAMALALAKYLPRYDNAVREGNWLIRSKGDPAELFEKTAGIIGLGNVGRRVAEILHNGFAMNIIGYDPNISQNDFPQYTLTSDIKDIFRKADVISVHCPSVPATKGIINSENLKLCKRGAIFINCARGDVMVENDVVRALEDGALSAAGLDVFNEEPLRADSPLISMDNVILTPHSAALTKEATIRMATTAARQALLFFHGETPEFIVK